VGGEVWIGVRVFGEELCVCEVVRKRSGSFLRREEW
jgi:hypothetical protein